MKDRAKIMTHHVRRDVKLIGGEDPIHEELPGTVALEPKDNTAKRAARVGMVVSTGNTVLNADHERAV